MENLAKALVAVQKVITNAPTNAVNPFFKSKYTDLATAVNHCRPVLAEHGFAIVQRFDVLNDSAPAITTTLIHESGEMLEGILPLQLPADPQKAGSVITYMRRYSYLAMVGIAPEDDDANSVSMPSKKPTPKPTAKPTVASLKKTLHGLMKTTTLSPDEYSLLFKHAFGDDEPSVEILSSAITSFDEILESYKSTTDVPI